MIDFPRLPGWRHCPGTLISCGVSQIGDFLNCVWAWLPVLKAIVSKLKLSSLIVGALGVECTYSNTPSLTHTHTDLSFCSTL